MDKIKFIEKYLPKIFGVITGIAGLLLLRFLLSTIYHNPYNKLNQIVDKLNEEKFTYIYGDIMFIRAERHKKTVELTYTIESKSWMTSDELKDYLKKSENYLRDYFIIEIKIEPFIDELRKRSVTFEQNFYDQSYNLLMKSLITPDDYK